MRVLVTGATGFVGGHLVSLLRRTHHEIYGTYLEQRKPFTAEAKLLYCDLRSPADTKAAVKQARPERIYHLAGRSSVQESFKDPRLVYETNFVGTLNLLESVREHAPKARVLLVGSGQSYGAVPADHLPVKEAEPFRPQNPYAASKAAADILGYQFFSSYGLYVIRTRPFNHTGPGQSAEYVCSNFARQFAAIGLGLQKPKIEVGDLAVQRDFSDVRDVVRAYQLMLESGTPGNAYNVGSGKLTSIRTIVHFLASFCPVKTRISVMKERLRPGQTPKLYGSIRQLRNQTGWKPDYGLNDTLKDLYAYWIEQLSSQIG